MAKWYEDGLRFECIECGRCCRGEPGAVWIRLDEMVRIARYLGISTTQFADDYMRLCGMRLSLAEKPNYDCIFLKDNQCIIYEVRPRQCRQFPFWGEFLRTEESYKKYTSHCPGIGRGRLFSFKEIEDIARGEADTNSFTGD